MPTLPPSVSPLLSQPPFLRPTNLQSTAKRQTAVPSESQNPFDSIVQPLAAGFNGSLAGPFNVQATYGFDGQGSDQLGSTFSQLFPAVFNGLAGPGNNVSVGGVIGQPSSSIGLGFFPVDGIGAGGFDFNSSFSQIAGPFADIISSIFNGTSFTTFPISSFGASGSFPGGTSPTFPGQNSTSPGLTPTIPSFKRAIPQPPAPNGAIPPFPGVNDITPVLPGAPNATLPDFGTVTAPPFPNPSDLPFPLPSNVTSSTGSQSSSISDEPLPTDVSTPPVASDDPVRINL